MLAARELLHIPVVSRRDGSRANLMLRGVDPASPELRPDFKIEAGRMFTPGMGECIVSRPDLEAIRRRRIGEVLKTGERESYRVVGLFTAGGSSAESEVWLDRKDLERNIAREGSVSSVQIRAAGPAEYRRHPADDRQRGPVPAQGHARAGSLPAAKHRQPVPEGLRLHDRRTR